VSIDPRRHAWGAFTTAGCDQGEPFLWGRHRARLEMTLEHLAPGAYRELPTSDEAASALRDAGIGGPGRLRLVAVARDSGGAWQVEMTATPVREVGPSSPPMRLAPIRWAAAPPLAGFKTLARLSWDLAAREAREAGADDAVLVSEQGEILETSVGNLWARFESRLRTPEAGRSCLPGVMRGWLVENLENAGFDLEVRPLSWTELLAADEVWMSNAVVGVRRIGAIGSRRWTSWPAFQELRSLGVPAPGWLAPQVAP